MIEFYIVHLKCSCQQMKRFCSMELARMRLEEREKCQKEIKQTQDMVNSIYFHCKCLHTVHGSMPKHYCSKLG